MRVLALAWLLLISVVHAEQQNYDSARHQVMAKDIEINFSVMNSTFIQPKVAEAYGLERAEDKAYLNVSLVKIDGTRRTKHKGKVKGEMFDLVIKQPLTFKLIEENNVAYYMAEFEIEHKLPVYFTLYVTPEGQTQPTKIQFKKLMYDEP